MPCLLFLKDFEKASLGAFVRTPFNNYNKSKELFERHSKAKYHLVACTRANELKQRWGNPSLRIDCQLSEQSAENYSFNSEVLSLIVESVLLCAKQRIPLQAHRQDKIDFSKDTSHNEGNFIALLRLLAKSNPILNKHLVAGPKNAKYISKTIQNEILLLLADQVRDFYRDCLQRCSHFSLICDEVTSHGKEILAVCLRFLEIDNEKYQVKPIKHEVLLDFYFLERITGKGIAGGILEVLGKHKIDIRNCRGQAYDTTASMSSSSVGVQALIKEKAPDADFQGCCLHSLNLVICHSSKIQAVRNMIDSCQQAFLFFHNSPKRQRFLEHIIKCTCPSTKKTKISGLCKTRWVERHNTFNTIFELYTYLVKTWEEISSPNNTNKELYPEGNDWKWDSESRSIANGLRYTFSSFEHVVVFLISKELLEPIRPIAECLQGRLQEVYFGFTKIDEVKQHYRDIREKVDIEHSRIYKKGIDLAITIGSQEAMPRVFGGRQTRPNPSVDSPSDYWRVTVTIPLIDSILSEMENRFSEEKRAHFELCSLIPEIIVTKDVEEISTILKTKWRHLLPAEGDLESELARWKTYCSTNLSDKPISQLLCEDADPIFYPNVRELLSILAVLPVGSSEAERSFSCLRQIHS